MKKAIAILLVLLVAGTMFGGTLGDFTNDADVDIKLQTVVAGKFGVKLTETALFASGDALGTKITNFAGASSYTGPVEFTEDSLSKTLYVSYMDNRSTPSTIEVDADLLKPVTAGISTTIGYTVSVGEAAAITVSADDTNIEFLTSTGSGMRVDSTSVLISMLESDWQAATADTEYSTTWTINLTSN